MLKAGPSISGGKLNVKKLSNAGKVVDGGGDFTKEAMKILRNEIELKKQIDLE